jgi:catechol 2,3-dioxygenase-like lactoylglutathione lyase family enzyme
MIGYVTIGSNDLDKARAFYSQVLGVLGAKEVMKFDSGFTMYGAGKNQPMVAITKPYDKNTATVGNGMMVALAAPSRAKVDEVYAKAMTLGAKDEGKPGSRGEMSPGQEFYGAYFRDLEGNKLCAFIIGPKA